MTTFGAQSVVAKDTHKKLWKLAWEIEESVSRVVGNVMAASCGEQCSLPSAGQSCAGFQLMCVVLGTGVEHGEVDAHASQRSRSRLLFRSVKSGVKGPMGVYYCCAASFSVIKCSRSCVLKIKTSRDGENEHRFKCGFAFSVLSDHLMFQLQPFPLAWNQLPITVAFLVVPGLNM